MRQQFVPENELSNIHVADSSSVDAFSRLRVSAPHTVFEQQAQYGANPLRCEAGKTNDGVTPAWSANTRMITLQINAGAAGGTSFYQSYQYLPYQPGKSQLALITGVVGAAVAGAVKRYGYGDANNGIFFEQNGTNGLQFNRRTSTSGGVVNNTVLQANWNLDRMDGTGPSGITLDTAKAFILFLDLQFLAMGRVRIGFDVDGQIWYAHEFLCSNVLSVPYMQTATLPIMGEIVAAAGLGSQVQMFWKCSSVVSEGGVEFGLGREFHAQQAVTAASGARTHILSIRPKLIFNTLTNRVFITPVHIDVLGGLRPVYWEMVVGATFTVAPVYADANTTYSAVEVGAPATFANLNNGIVINAGYVGSGTGSRAQIESPIAVSYPITLDRAGANRDLGTLSFLVTGIGGTSDCQLCCGWYELR